MKFAFALLLISVVSVAARAKTFDLRDLDSRPVIEREDGSLYVQLHPGDDLYARYRAQIRAIISEGLEESTAHQFMFKSEDEKVGPKKAFVGFELPTMTQLYGIPTQKRWRGSRLYRPMAISPVVDTEMPEGAVFVPSCRNPQGPLDLDDPMNARLWSCFPSVMIFKKIY
jgi:hypothetical protein